MVNGFLSMYWREKLISLSIGLVVVFALGWFLRPPAEPVHSNHISMMQSKNR